MMNNNFALATILVSSIYGSYYMATTGSGIRFFTNAETTIKGIRFFGFMVMYETIFGRNESGLVEMPDRLSAFLKKDWVKVGSLFAISFASTKDIEQSFFVTIAFLAFVHLWRTPEERLEHPYMI